MVHVMASFLHHKWSLIIGPCMQQHGSTSILPQERVAVDYVNRTVPRQRWIRYRRADQGHEGKGVECIICTNDLFEEWSLNAPINDQTGHPYAPSRQLLAMWVVQAWKKIPEELVKKAWVVSGYTDMVDLEDQAASREIVEYSTEDLGSMVEKYVGDDAMMAWIDECNEHDPDFLFPEEDETEEDVVGEDEVEDSSSEEEEYNTKPRTRTRSSKKKLDFSYEDASSFDDDDLEEEAKNDDDDDSSYSEDDISVKHNAKDEVKD